MGSSDPPAGSLLGERARPWIGGVLVIVGVQCWLILGQGQYGRRFQLWLLLGALAVSIIPPVNRRVLALLDRWRNPSVRTRITLAIAIGLLSTLYFPVTAWHQNRDFVPIWQDAQSYAIQVQMLAHGRLWMPPHPLADFFDTFQMIVKPVYASMYFPGASIFYVPAVWLGIPFWVVSAIFSGACVGLIYWVISDVIDGMAGVLAGLMLVGLETFRHISIMLLGHPAIILLQLLMIAFWLAWRKDKTLRLALPIGFTAGWAAITRPLDALIVAIPIGIDMLIAFRAMRPRAAVQTMGAVTAAAAPFLILQIIFNIGVTGSWTRTPFDLHADLYYPGTSLGFHTFDPNLRPASVLPQKQKFHDDWTIPAIQRHQPDRILRNWLDEDLHHMVDFTLPHPWLTILLPAGLVGLVRRPRSLIVLMIPLWIAFYTFYTFFLPHYTLILAPPMILLALLGAQQIEHFWPRARGPVTTFLTLSIVLLCLTQTHEFNRIVRDQNMDATELRTIDARLASEVQPPAVVLFRFPPGGPPAIEPVYNLTVPWPDDAPIIRAHDLGDRNVEIFNYYAKLQPDRRFYLCDRGTGSLTDLGLAKDLGNAN